MIVLYKYSGGNESPLKVQTLTSGMIDKANNRAYTKAILVPKSELSADAPIVNLP